MRMIMLGPPGAGKGTQAQEIAKEYAIPQISTGDMLRQSVESGSDRGRRLKAIMDAGELIPDDTIISMVCDRLLEDDCRNGYLLDGFPRTMEQADGLKRGGVEIDYVIELHSSDEEIVRRLDGRRVHPESGRVYHIEFNPPRVAGKDDETGDPLVKRDDDNEDTVKKRLDVYHSQTKPLIQFYLNEEKKGNLRCLKVEGIQGVEEVRKHLLQLLSSMESDKQ